MEARLRGGKETARGFDEIAEAQKRAGRQTEEMSAKGGRLSGILDRLGSGAKGFIAGFVGIAAVQRALGEIVRQMQKILDLRRSITQEGLNVRETTLPLAAQLFAGGGLTQQQAQDLAADIAPQIARGGVSIATATQFGVAGDVNLVGGLRSAEARKRNLPILQELAGFGGGAALGAAESGKLLEVLKTFGLTGSAEDIFKGVAQTQAAFARSRSTSFGAFLTQVQTSAAGLALAGFGLPSALELNVQAREVARGELPAGETLNVLARKIQSADVAKLINRRFGVDFFAAKPDEQIAFMRRVFAEADTAAKRAALTPTFSGEEALRLGNLLSPANIEATREALPAIMKADPDLVLKSAREFAETNLGRERVLAANQAARRERQSRTTALEDQLRRIAEKRLEEAIQAKRIKTSFFLPGFSEEAAQEAIVAEMLIREGRKAGLTRFDLFPAETKGRETGVRIGTFYGIADIHVTEAVKRVRESLAERGVPFDIRVPPFPSQEAQPSTTVNIGTAVFPRTQDAPPRFDIHQR